VKPFEEKTLINALNKSLSHYQLEYLDKTGANTADIDASQLYDLSKLKEMSRGNTPFVVKMLQIFVSLTTKSIEDMQVAWGNKDIDRLRQIAHKIKPSIDDMGIQILKNDIRTMEQFPAEQAADMMQPLVQKVTVVLQQVVQAVQNKELAEGK
jgi:HPt (histidine-containing phosphotransfer) domain-containing protein